MAGRVQEIRSKPVGSTHVARARDYIRKRYRKTIRLGGVAKALDISPGHLSHPFRREIGACLQDAIAEVRVHRTVELLFYSRLSLSETAICAGFTPKSMEKV